MKIIYCRRLLTLSLIFLLIEVAGCKKEENQEIGIQKPEIENFDKLFKFVSVISGIPKDELKFDYERMGFYLPGTSFYMSLEEVQRYYEKANVYKEMYENQ